ncbi:MAG: hypothetical protein HKN32_08430, partial [Flavobacteriales bacterium]|nr:hypothetical protein [Flavobacteriales bacterium]
PLQHLGITLNGTTYFTNTEGQFSTPITGPTEATFSLEGLYSSVNTGGVVPSTTLLLADGDTDISLTQMANEKEVSAYSSVNRIHDHMKVWLPDYTVLDAPMITNIDVAGECNAFYDGNINFFDAGGGCNASSLIADVVWHEYGHAINGTYYQDNGLFFSNGAMNEGYADFWAMSLSDSPIVGEGFFADSGDGIRRYDIDPKIYPQDLVGEVHADGEIICGAWYDTHLLMGANWNATMELFIETYNGFQATGFNGNEGQIFFDVLLDALQADDTNEDLSDGTPNDIAIVEGFAMHGIYLLSGAQIEHADVFTAPADELLTLQAEIDIDFPFNIYLQEAKLYYRFNNEIVWLQTPLDNPVDNVFEATIDAQPEGTVVSYFFGLIDIYDNITTVEPTGAFQDDPTLPYFTLIGMNKVLEHDSDISEDLGEFETGVASDLATAGQWELNIPIGSYANLDDPETIMSPNMDHTPDDDGELCFITQQAASPTGSMYDTDVD